MAFTKAEIAEIVRPIFDGQVNLANLPPRVFQFIYEKFRADLESGFGEKLGDQIPGSERERFMKAANKNVGKAAANKTFQQVRSIQQLGTGRDFEDFIEDAEPVFRKYKETGQRTEEQLTFRRSRAGEHWSRIQENKDLFPILEYRTQGDSRVRDEHEELDGIIKPVDDPFWDVYFPPNGWNCRCDKPRQRYEGPASEVDERMLPELEELHNDNPGKTGKVFKDEHPYFDVPSEYSEAQDANFGFEIPN